MRSRILIASLMGFVLLGARATTVAAQRRSCVAEDRWPAKVMSDSLSRGLTLDPEPTTIAALVRFPEPRERPTTIREGLERRAFRVRAWILERRDGQADGDLHLVIVDPADSQAIMIAELPDSACAAGSPRASDYAEARRVLDRFNDELEFEIEGLVFFDRDHGQTGMAANGMEIHPVLRITPVLITQDLLQEDVGAAVDTADARVWVNRNSKVYHCPGTAMYGKTRNGFFTSESAAQKAGNRPAAGRRCR